MINKVLYINPLHYPVHSYAVMVDYFMLFIYFVHLNCWTLGIQQITWCGCKGVNYLLL